MNIPVMRSLLAAALGALLLGGCGAGNNPGTPPMQETGSTPTQVSGAALAGDATRAPRMGLPTQAPTSIVEKPATVKPRSRTSHPRRRTAPHTSKPTASVPTPTREPTAPQPPRPTATLAPTMPPETPVPAEPTVPPERPLAPEQNPPGDIPDTQAFVRYASPAGGYTLEAPEGWARREKGTDVSFTDKFDGVEVTVGRSAKPPDSSPGSAQVEAIRRSGRAVEIGQVKQVQLPAGGALLVRYTSNSEPDAVTGKQVRLENDAYLFYKDGKLAELHMWAPFGADNVDQWRRMSESFRWS